MPPSPPLAQPSEGYHALCPGNAERKVQHSAQLELGQSWQGSSLLERVAQALVGFHSNLLTCIQTNCLDSTCAEPYCVFMFLFKREVYLAIIINKWIFFSEATVHASSRCSWWLFSPRRSQQGSPGTYQSASLSGSDCPSHLTCHALRGTHSKPQGWGYLGFCLRQSLYPKSTHREL